MRPHLHYRAPLLAAGVAFPSNAAYPQRDNRAVCCALQAGPPSQEDLENSPDAPVLLRPAPLPDQRLRTAGPLRVNTGQCVSLQNVPPDPYPATSTFRPVVLTVVIRNTIWMFYLQGVCLLHPVGKMKAFSKNENEQTVWGLPAVRIFAAGLIAVRRGAGGLNSRRTFSWAAW